MKKIFKRAGGYRQRIISLYNLVNLCSSLVFFMLLPYLLNFSLGAFTGKMGWKGFFLSYLTEFILILSLTSALGSLLLMIILKDIDVEPANNEAIDRLRAKCFNLPYQIFIAQIGIPILVSSLLLIPLAYGKMSWLAMSKLLIVILAAVSLAAGILLIFLKRLFKKKLLSLGYRPTEVGIYISLRNKIFLQILPLLLISLLFMALIGYSRLTSEKGDLLFKIHKYQLKHGFTGIGPIRNIGQIKQALQMMNFDTGDHPFIITPQGRLVTVHPAELEKIFRYNLTDSSDWNNGLITDCLGETQGAFIPLPDEQGRLWKVGVYYRVTSARAVTFFSLTFTTLLLLSILILYFYARSFTEGITLVTHRLKEIASGANVTFSQKIPVTSNDEIGVLINAFNKLFDVEQKKALAGQETVLSQERHRFARDIHDTLGQTMTLLITLLRICSFNMDRNPEKTRENLKKAITIAEAGLKDVRRSVTGLAPANLETKNLIQAIRKLCADFQSSTTETRINFSVSGYEFLLEPQYIRTIYRVCQEALTNAIRHGHAKNIDILLQFNPDNIKLFIFDDGKGCKKILKGFGLTGMEERVKIVSGAINYGSDGETGFNIHVEIPIPKTDPALCQDLL